MTQVDRLEALLARVQQNRQQQPHVASPDVLASKQAAGAPTAPAAPPVHAAPAQASPAQAPSVYTDERTAPGRLPDARPAEARPAAKPAAPVRAPSTPLEMAVEGRVQRQQPAAPVSYEGRVVVDPQPVQATRPIAQVVSMHPPSQALTFGELLRRSLSLRPR